jgi:glucan-binding YG repeat protein
MKTGWVENSDGKWYYLDSSGKMIKDPLVMQ